MNNNAIISFMPLRCSIHEWLLMGLFLDYLIITCCSMYWYILIRHSVFACMRYWYPHCVVIINHCTYAGPPGRNTVFQNIPSGWYTLRITAISDMEKENVNWKVYIPTTSSTCSVNLINAGLVVDGANVFIEFRGVGSTAGFTCKLDKEQFSSCEL